MQRMWSPWRSEYVESTAQQSPTDAEHSVFTRLEQDGNDEQNLIVWRGEQVFVMMNKYPYNNGHLLIVPYHEVQAYDALTPKEQMAVARAIDRCIRWLRHALDPDGFNVGMNLEEGSGAGIPEHLHVHVVPRWNGDTNFMTTTRETRVLPESLASTYKRLQDAIEAIDPAAPSP